MHAQTHATALRGIETIVDLAGNSSFGYIALAEALAYRAMPLCA